jgi:ankyrin repeat protein
MISLLLATALATATPSPAADALPTPERRQQLLFDAARLGRADMVAPLVKAGVDLNATDTRGFTPLILAAYNGQAETLDALISAGADPCKPDASQGNTAQMGVAFKGNDAIAARLLTAGCDVNARNNAGQTALMMAVLFDRSAQVAMLVKAGADPALADASGRTAKAVAQGQGNDAMVAQLEGRN